MLDELDIRFDHPHRKIVISEVTRMTGGLVCVAGIDLRTGGMVRPLQPGGNNWEEEAWVNDGHFAPGNVIGLEAAQMGHRGLPHAHEDFFVSRVSLLGSVTQAELFSACNETADVDIHTVIGEDLIDNKYVVEGSACRSLFCVIQPVRSLRLSDRYEKIQLSFPSEYGWYNLPVTDLKAKEAGDATAGVENLQTRIDAAASHVAIRLGLAREWDGHPHHNYDPKRCYLQVNGIVGN